MGKRKSKNLSTRKSIIIFTEGVTERLYFDMLKEKYNFQNVYSEDVPKIYNQKGKGTAEKLIQHAIATIEHEKKFRDLPIEMKLVVFDKDNVDEGQIAKALKFASENGFTVLYSNECFDFWLLRHYENCDRHIKRKEIFKKLTEYMGFDDYEKHKADSKLKELLKDRVHVAMSTSYPKLDEAMIGKNPYTNAPEIIKMIFKKERY